MARRNHLLQLDDAPVSGLSGIAPRRTDRRRDAAVGDRSEEHTSELQSRLHLVCRLLLEKKKTKQTSNHSEQRHSIAQPCLDQAVRHSALLVLVIRAHGNLCPAFVNHVSVRPSSSLKARG